MKNDRDFGRSGPERLVVDGTDTLANVLRRRLADKILNGELQPGARLDEQTIADHYGVSRTPVREAITQLGSSGLVEIRPRRSALVVPIDTEFLAQLFEAAAHVEAICAAFAAMRMTLTERARLARVFQDCVAACDRRDAEDFAAHHRLFHNTIRDGAHNPALAECLKQCRRQIAPFTKASHADFRNMQATVEDQRNILSAINDQDEARAGLLMKRHLSQVGIRVVDEYVQAQT